MKREHIISGTEPLPPFSENLVFYAPLTNGDLTDHISGTNPTLTGNGIMTWDTNEQAYMFKMTTSSNSCIAYWNVDFTGRMNLNVSQEYTIFSKVKVVNYVSGYPYILGLGNWNNSSSYKPHINAETCGHPSTIMNCACIRYSNNSMYFMQANRTETNSSSHMSNPANWNNINLCANRVCVYFRRWNEDTANNAYAYIKDCMVFNRALTPAEVAQL